MAARKTLMTAAVAAARAAAAAAPAAATIFMNNIEMIDLSPKTKGNKIKSQQGW